MALHHVLCIHGIGRHSTKWTSDADDDDQSFEDLLEELWDKYPATNRKGSFAKNAKIHSICYDDEVDKIFGAWKKHGDDLKAGLKLSPLLLDEVQWFTDVIDAAEKAKGKAHWGYTHLLDLLLFAASPTLQDRVVTHSGLQLVEAVKAAKGAKVSVIGHSMGCAMAHKAIQALFNETVETPEGPQTLKGDFKFENVTMVANTSYALSRDRKTHYSGLVRPSLTAGEGCCFSWINANHMLDPVAQFQRFDHTRNPQWLDPKIEGRGWHRDIRMSRISSKSIHSLNHYFRDPALHIAFFELAFDARFTDPERGAAVDAFIDSTPEGKFKGLKAQLELLDVSNAQNFKDLFVALQSFREALRLFKPGDES